MLDFATFLQRSPRFSGILGIITLLFFAPGCAADKETPASLAPTDTFVQAESAPQTVKPPFAFLEPRAFFRPNQPVLLLVRITPDQVRPAELLLTTDDGQEIEPLLVRIFILETPRGAQPSPGRTWLGVRGTWDNTDIPFQPADTLAVRLREAQAIHPVGLWAMLFTPPENARWVAAGTTRIDLTAITDPPQTLVRGQAVLSRRAAAQLSPETAPAFLANFIASADAPTERWRTRAFAPGDQPAPPDSPTTPAQPPLDLLANLVTTRWHAAMGRLDAASPAVAGELATALLRVVHSERASFPLFPGDESRLDELQSDLLAARPEQLATIARQWLDARPTSFAMLLDDSGSSDNRSPSRRMTFFLGNLTPKRLLGFVSDGAPRPAQPTDLAALQPYNALTLESLVNVPAPPAADALTGADPVANQPAVLAHIGTTSLRRLVQPGRIPARPGLGLGPLRPDWSMSSFIRIAGSPDAVAAAPAVDPGFETAATLLYQKRTGGAASGWTVFVECKHAGVNAGAGGTEQIQLHFGPLTRPSSIIAVTADGSGVDTVTNQPVAVQVTRETDRWVAWIPVPTTAIASDGLLRLGISRTDSRSVRSGWPRPMLPWMNDPGRASIDLSEWRDSNVPVNAR